MRIIAGKYKGRPLRAPKALDTRPTTERVREALFGVLGDVSGARVVDCYSGTGALGLEALSRGASHAVLIESWREAQKCIEKNVATLGAEAQVTLLGSPVERARQRLAALAPFDLVLADPPWPIADAAALAVAKLIQGLVTPDAVVVLGHPARSPIELPSESGLELVDRRGWGDSAMSWFAVL